MKVVIALGGNALGGNALGGGPGKGPPGEGRQGDRSDPVSPARVRRAGEAVAAVAREHAVVVTHGNGPQVGALALLAEGELGAGSGAPPRLDVLDAESEGWLGYLLEQEVEAHDPGRPVVALVTRVEVDPDDPAFLRPSKPIGPVYAPARGRSLATERGWTLVADRGGLRRAVPSPRPRRILELGAVRALLDAGMVVVCAGGGGIPVCVDGARSYGVEAVIDKDRTASLLAEGIGADVLLLLTDERAVWADWPGRQRPIERACPAELRAIPFDEGTMGPKVEAACDFVERTGGVAAIAALEDAARALAGEAGTRVEGG